MLTVRSTFMKLSQGTKTQISTSLLGLLPLGTEGNNILLTAFVLDLVVFGILW